jgi:hypothetical protein
MKLSALRFGMVLLLLAACTAPKPPPRAVPMALTDPTPGFNDKEPDTCKAGALQGLVGQPSGMARTVRAAGPMRIIGPVSVYDQDEYRSDRINLFIDAQGIITRIGCG